MCVWCAHARVRALVHVGGVMLCVARPMPNAMARAARTGTGARRSGTHIAHLVNVLFLMGVGMGHDYGVSASYYKQGCGAGFESFTLKTKDGSAPAQKNKCYTSRSVPQVAWPCGALSDYVHCL